MNAHEIANALEGLLRSEVWRLVERELHSMREQETALALQREMPPDQRAAAAAAATALQAAVDVPGRLHEQYRNQEE